MRFAFLAALALASSVAVADQWEPPERKTYASDDQQARLTIVPRDLESASAYFRDKVAHREPAGAPQGAKARTATVIIEQKDASGEWKKSWSGPIPNEIAPVDVLVADHAAAFVTLDDWHGLGYSQNAVAIYRGDGTLIRHFALSDLFPDWFIAALPHSVSSIWWRQKPRLSADQSTLIIPVVRPAPDEAEAFREGKTADLAFRIADGAPVGLESNEWKTVLDEAASVARAMCVSERQYLQLWNQPIKAPISNKEEDWHFYLNETQFRTKRSHQDGPYPATTVLRSPGATDFAASVEWLRTALTEKAVIPHDLRAIGSPDTENLTTWIEKIAADKPRGLLRNVDLVIVSDTTHTGRIRQALSQSGANLTFIDPAVPIPQVKERLQKEGELVVCRVPAPSGEESKKGEG
ncbi:hypothetical protein ACLB0R_01310 [Sphingomonas sp. GlSt437]|uniref:hypothetical protein n=1 Tax=Sphingomonas sp. GlSt437 TaxID=3389970 RepID=UPI003A8C670E